MRALDNLILEISDADYFCIKDCMNERSRRGLKSKARRVDLISMSVDAATFTCASGPARRSLIANRCVAHSPTCDVLNAASNSHAGQQVVSRFIDSKGIICKFITKIGYYFSCISIT